MKTPVLSGDTTRGYEYLTREIGTTRASDTTGICELRQLLIKHPLDLEIPRLDEADPLHEIFFTGALADWENFEIFLAETRPSVQIDNGASKIQTLRVIDTPIGPRDSRRITYFEVHTRNKVFIFKGAVIDPDDRTTLEKLQSFEDVFAWFSFVYQIPIERHATEAPFNIEACRAEEVFAA